MNANLRGLMLWPSAFAVLFFLMPVLLAYFYPSSFWANTDYETLGLADAFNMAYRLADRHMYPSVGMSYHPGVPFYFVSWLALALAGYPVASGNAGFFNAVIEHVEDYHQITICLGALTGAIGVYIFARAARNLVPIGVVAAGLLIWLVSTPATLLMFLSPSIDSFAIVINSLFFAVLVRLAYDQDLTPTLAVFAGCVGALAYLNKLSYVYIPLTIVITGIAGFALRRVDWIRGRRISVCLAVALLIVTYAIASRLAQDRGIALDTIISSGLGRLLAYLNRFYYTYIPLAFIIPGAMYFAFPKITWVRTSAIAVLTVVAFLAVIYTVGYLIIGPDGFNDFLRYHQKVVFGSGLYGTGQEDIVSSDEIFSAFAAIPAGKAYAVIIAMVGGFCLAVGGFFNGLKGAERVPVAVISIGSGLASLLSALIVIKHYDIHYTAGISATLPASVVSSYLLARSRGLRPRAVATAVGAIALLFMGYQAAGVVHSTLASRTNQSQLAKLDLEEIEARLAGSKRTTEFAYRAPLSGCGEGFVIVYASVPRLADEYLQSRPNVISSMTAGLADREVGAYVIDKGYFPTAESIKASPNVALLGAKQVTFKDGDKLIELRTVFLLIPS